MMVLQWTGKGIGRTWCSETIWDVSREECDILGLVVMGEEPASTRSDFKVACAERFI